MKRGLMVALSAAAIYSFASAVHSFAQEEVYVAPTYPYTYDYNGALVGPFVMLGTPLAVGTVVETAPPAAYRAPFGEVRSAPIAQSRLERCAVLHDFNGRNTVLCGP
jgi:hypothetical protein